MGDESRGRVPPQRPAVSPKPGGASKPTPAPKPTPATNERRNRFVAGGPPSATTTSSSSSAPAEASVPPATPVTLRTTSNPNANRRERRESARVAERAKSKQKSDGKSFGDRFDTHAKRWQTVAALIVALGVIIGFVGNKMGWHFPDSWFHDPPPAPPVAADANLPTTLHVRYLKKDWGNQVDLDGTNPTFEVSAGYDNITEVPHDNVYMLLQYDTRLVPIKGTAILRNSTNPDGLAITNQDWLNTDWMNVGDYEPGGNAYVRHMFTLNSDDFPCGDTTMTMRTMVRDVAFEDTENDMFSPEALVVYHKRCKTTPT